jgi:chemotaxis protein MotB
MKPVLQYDDPEVPVWASYTDVAINVLVVLLLYLFTQATLATLRGADLLRVREEQKKLRDAVFSSVPEQLRSYVTVVEDGQLLRYRFADRVLFTSGSDILMDSGQEILGHMGRAFQAHAGSFSSIQVEGHTDDRPIRTAKFHSNWELSSARATSVVRFLEGSGIEPTLLSATGYSEYHPVAANDSESARDRNRRIEVVVVYTTLDPTSAR